MGFHGFSKIVVLVCEHFLPPLLIALSVVSMEVFAPHKMADIRLIAWQGGGPGSENRSLRNLRTQGFRRMRKCYQLLRMSFTPKKFNREI